MSPMQIPKLSDADRAAFEALVPDDPRVVVKPMFGNLGAYVNGNMFMGSFGPQVGVKLEPAAAERLRAAGGGQFGPAERPMGGYVTLPDDIVRSSGGAASGESAGAAWTEAALDYVATLPPKVKKPARKK